MIQFVAAYQLDIRDAGCGPFIGKRCINGTNICATSGETNPPSPNVWYTVKVPKPTDYCGIFWSGYDALLKFTVTQNSIIPAGDPDANFKMRVYIAKPNCSNMQVHPFYATVAANAAGCCVRAGEQYFIEVFGTNPGYTNTFILCWEFADCVPGYEFSPPPPPYPHLFRLLHPPSPPPIIYGCTNPAATNYNPLATIDDGTCNFDNQPSPRHRLLMFLVARILPHSIITHWQQKIMAVAFLDRHHRHHHPHRHRHHRLVKTVLLLARKF
jgi:hypothetical protein